MVDAGTPCIVSIDQGTSSTKAVAVDRSGHVRAVAHAPISIEHPAPGHVQQDASEIAASVRSVIGDIAAQLAGVCEVVGVGISSQRESAVMWDRVTGEPIGPMLGWQDRRTADAAQRRRGEGIADEVRRRSGLPLDPMFSALKFAWLLDDAELRRRAIDGHIAAGTVDCWLVSTLTGEHRIEAGNASRTQLMNVARVEWDDVLLDVFGIPAAVLPPIVRSDEPTGPILSGPLAGTPILGVLGDSHAALYAHGVRVPGAIKATYGTGSSVMGLVADIDHLDEGVVATVAWQTGSPAFAGEGNILSTGATVAWLAGVLDLDPTELMALARSASAPGPVDLVPAFAGLGAPWWDEGAVATISGMDLGTSRADLAAAAADSVVLQIEDVVSRFDRSGTPTTSILVDGGPADNDWLMQRQADLSQRNVTRRAEVGLSALGAAHLAGSTAGLFDPDHPLPAMGSADTFEPQLDSEAAAHRVRRWRTALERSRLPVDVGDGPGLERQQNDPSLDERNKEQRR